MSVKHLTAPIEGVHASPEAPRYGYTRDGYTTRRGAPTRYKVRLAGERRLRRVMTWCFSNAGTLFIRIKGEPHVVNGFDLQDAIDRQITRGGEL